MDEVKRFDMTVIDYAYMEDCRSESVIGEVSGGNYVLHSDYLAEVERLQARVSELESALKRQGNAAKMGMDAAKKGAIWREENAKRLLSESNPAAIESERAANAELTEEIGHLEDSLIKQGQMLREIVNITKGPPEENSWHSTHDAVESVERLQARVAELEAEEEGAQEAFGVIVDKMKDLRSRNLQIEKTIHRQVIEISRLYRSGARPLSNDAAKAGGDDE